jgi:hypothetical protein
MSAFVKANDPFERQITDAQRGNGVHNLLSTPLTKYISSSGPFQTIVSHQGMSTSSNVPRPKTTMAILREFKFC